MPSSNFLRSLFNLTRSAPTLLYIPTGTTDGGGEAQAAPPSADNPLHVTGIVTVDGGGSADNSVVDSQTSAVIDATSRALPAIPGTAVSATLQVRGSDIYVRLDGQAAAVAAASRYIPDGSTIELEQNELAGFRYVGVGTGTLSIVFYKAAP